MSVCETDNNTTTNSSFARGYKLNNSVVTKLPFQRVGGSGDETEVNEKSEWWHAIWHR
jgi:hypothetical protein